MTREDAVTTLKDISEMVHKQKEIEKSTLYGILDSNNEPIEAFDMAIKALETLEEFEKAQIITGGRLNGRTYAYKCGLEDGKRKALEQEPCEDCLKEMAERVEE